MTDADSPVQSPSQSSGQGPPPALPRRIAAGLAEAERLPTAARAVLGYYADTGERALGAVRVRRRVDEYVEGVIAEAFAAVDRAVAAEFDLLPDEVGFAYDTKLVMPAELTLGHVYGRASERTPAGFDPVTGERRSRIRLGLGRRSRNRRPDPETRIAARPQVETVERAEAVTALVVVALLDGDMRDALNDEEFDDFEVAFDADAADRRRIAEIAQSRLRETVADRFADFPDAVREAYESAVERSERHQDRDPRFRELMAEARDGDEEALAAIEAEYKHGDFEAVPEMFTATELDFPYLKTQYGRVGVIYDGMIEMYRAAGVAVEDTFKRSIVFAIVGAQIWLDDVDDYRADLAENQLTPVTAEYLLRDTDREAYRAVVGIARRYIEAAKVHAAATDSPLAGIGADYILRSGHPEVLPGSDG